MDAAQPSRGTKQTNDDKTNATYKTTDAQIHLNCIRTALERSVEKLLGADIAVEKKLNTETYVYSARYI